MQSRVCRRVTAIRSRSGVRLSWRPPPQSFEPHAPAMTAPGTFLPCNRAERCPVSRLKQPCSRNPETAEVDPRRTSHGQTQTSGSGGADLSFPVAAHPLPRISSADNARRDLRRQKTSVQARSSQTRAPSLQNCASGPPKNPYAMRRYRRRHRRGRTIRT